MGRRFTRTLVAALVSTVIAGGSTTPAEAGVCSSGISPETAAHLFAILDHPPAEPDCKFEGVTTTHANLEARWSWAGTALPPVSVAPRACSSSAAAPAGLFTVEIPAEIGRRCPSIAPLIDELVKQLAGETPVGESANAADPLFPATRLLFALIALVAAGLLIRGASRLRSFDGPWIIAAIASFFAALAVRASLPFSMGNWYSEVLPAAGAPPWMRFGPGYFAFQSLLRDAGIWSPRALVVSQLLFGAAALPLFLGVLRELRVGLAGAAAALVLLVFAPFHARLSATSSEHVLASSLCLGLLLGWLRAARTGDRLWLALTALLFPAVCATRVDMTVQASLVLLWPLVRDRSERAVGLHGWSLGWRAALLAVIGASTLAAAYRFIVLQSHHPMPELEEQMFALRNSIGQFWQLATQEPGWMSLSAVLLAIVGAAAMAVRRPLLLARVVGTLLVTFGVAGRFFLPDELLGARYFLFTIPVLLIASGYGFEALLTPMPERYRGAAAAVGLVLLGTWSGLAARSAYGVRYAFQDEYAFLRDALARLPDQCVVYEVGMRPAELSRDLDCCLDVRRSPLVLDFPNLQFREMPDTTASVFEPLGCAAYYESIVCDIADDPNDPVVHDRADRAADYFHQRCAQARGWGRLEPVAETTTAPLATVNFFHGRRPHAGLYRWTP